MKCHRDLLQKPQEQHQELQHQQQADKNGLQRLLGVAVGDTSLRVDGFRDT